MTCACGKTLQVPTLRNLRELEPAKEDALSRKGASGKPVDWSAARGMLFSLALLVLALSLPYGAYHTYVWSTINVAAYEAHEEANSDEYLDKMTPVALLEFWNDTKDKSLKDTLPPGHVSIHDVVDYYRNRGQAGLIVAAISGVLVAWSLLGNRAGRVPGKPA